MNRHDRRQQNTLSTTGYQKALEAENRHLRNELQRMIELHNTGVPIIQAALAGKQITINTDERLPPGSGALVPLTELQRRDKISRKMFDEQATFMDALYQLLLVFMHIDTLAIRCPLRYLQDDLSGKDEEMVSLLYRLMSQAQELGIEDKLKIQVFKQHVSERIEGIKRVKHDGGDYLRGVVIRLGAVATRDAESLRVEIARQGRKLEPRTKRLAEYADRFYCDGRTWDQANDALLVELQSRQRDDIDEGIMGELQVGMKPLKAARQAAKRAKQRS